MGKNLRKDLSEKKKALTIKDIKKAAKKTGKMLDKKQADITGMTRIPEPPGSFKRIKL